MRPARPAVCLLLLCIFLVGVTSSPLRPRTTIVARSSPPLRWAATRTGSRPVPTATCGSPSQAGTDRPDHPEGRSPSLRRPPSQPAGRGIAAGPDGNLWFTDTAERHRADHATAVDHVLHRSAPGAVTRRITQGPDGNLWFTEHRRPHRADHRRPGRITEFSAGLTPGRPPRITPGPTATCGSPRLSRTALTRTT